MKGVIPQCLGELIQSKFGKEKWTKVLERSGLDKNAVFLATADFDDKDVEKVLQATCKELGLTLSQAAMAFGEYWMTEFAPKIYGPYLRRASNARDFLLNLNSMHAATTKTLPGARPPRFECSWKDDRTLVLEYSSQRKLLDFVVGLAKGVGKYYRENLEVTRVGEDRVSVLFPIPCRPKESGAVEKRTARMGAF